jgi:two-component system sensor histidine kinase QseC
MISLRRRLLGRLLTLFLLTWALLAALSYFAARHEIEELFDAELAQSARVLLNLTRHELEEQDAVIGQPAVIGAGPHAYEEKIAFQVWRNETLLLRSSNAPAQLMSRSAEFGEEQIAGHVWRTFTLVDDTLGVRISVGERDDVRDELIFDILATTLLPVLLTLPLLAVLIWSGVSRALTPLNRVGSEIARRTPQQLDPLATGPVPLEVRPLVEALNRLLARLEDALTSERRFTANAAHELRTPLAALKAQAQVAQRAASDAERRHALEQIVRGTDRATRLIEQMLTLARLDPESVPVQQRPVDLAALAAEVVAELAPQALARRIELALTEAPQAMVAGDAALLAVLLRNLTDNAIRYTPEAGSVEVALHPTARAVELTVTDSGPGIPAAERERVFERFYRLNDGGRAAGSGLGLSIVRRIADLHGGSIALEDAPGGGLRVRVRLPAPAAVT